MNPINLFGQTIKSGIPNKEYVDSKFITLTRLMKTKLDLNFAQQNFVQKAGDKMTGNLDMSGNRLTNTGAPVNENDCAILNSINKDTVSKLYVQITNEQDETNAKKLCKIGDIITIILTKYRTEQFASVLKDQFLNSFEYAISLYSKYKHAFDQDLDESGESNAWVVGSPQDVSNCTIIVDYKINIVKLIESLPKDIFQEFKKELNKESLFSTPDWGVRARYRKFLINGVKELDPEGTNEQLQLLFYKNLLLIDIGFIYLIDSLLHILLE